MKKTLIVFGLILLTIYVVLTVLDRGDYVVEKRIWRVQKELNGIRMDPKAVPEQRFESVARKFQQIIQRYPNSKLVPHLYIQMAEVYALGKKFDKARESLTQILTKYSTDDNLCSTALFNIALTYEQEKSSSQAAAIFEKIIKLYPLTDLGLELYIYRADLYRQTGKSSESTEVLQDGVEFYKTVVENHPGTKQEYKALMLLSTAYMAQEKWAPAVKVLGEALMKVKYLNVSGAQNIIRSINTVSVIKLRDYDVPIGIYQKFIQQYPDHSLSKFLQQTVSSLKLLKSKNAIIAPKKKE